jgi:wyosine [tRNA(Phe)-imidazoG37] synthetase (radical SAM superfamily)
VKDLNDSDEELHKLKSVIELINPDKIHINTVVRPPSEKSARPISSAIMQKIRDIFGRKAEIIAQFTRDARSIGYIVETERQILDIIKRRPVTLEDIQHISGLHRHEIIKYLDILKAHKKIQITDHGGYQYYEPVQGG